jgi:D-3-phosphoglycerate dehydrogenase
VHGIVLDSLFSDLDRELEVARAEGHSLARWSGGNAELATADFALHVRTAVDATMISRLGRCRAIGRFGTGLDTVDLGAASAREIAVVGVPDYASDEVAQHAVMLALAASRGVAYLGRTPPRSAWDRLLAGPVIGITGPVGIVGYGHIGRRAAAMFQGLGLEVIVATRNPPPRVENGIIFCALDELLGASEVVSLHTALVPETHHLIDATKFDRMRPDAVLVNTARGALVDPGALIEALRSNQIRGAGLDVFETSTDTDWWEQLRADDLNVVMTPHIAWFSNRSVDRLRRECVQRTIAAAEERPRVSR